MQDAPCRDGGWVDVGLGRRLDASRGKGPLPDGVLKNWLKWQKGKRKLCSDTFRCRRSPRDFGEFIGKQVCLSVSTNRAGVITDTVDTVWH